MTSRNKDAKFELFPLGVVMLTTLLVGCATTPKDYTAFTDEQLVAEHDKTGQRIANAEAQLGYLQSQAAYAVTQEQSAASNLSAAIVAAQLNQLQANRASAIQEAQKRLAQRQSTSPTPPAAQPAQPESQPQTPPPRQPIPPTPSEPEAQDVMPAITQLIYPGSLQGHWVAEILSDGHYVRLDDESVWEVDSVDAIDSALWLMTEGIVVTADKYKGYVFYDLINTDSKDKVGATYLGTAVLQTQIEGDFEGWDGDTVFVLANGNILKQATYQYTYHYAYRPDVIVVNRGGVLVMVVDGVEETVGVVVIR